MAFEPNRFASAAQYYAEARPHYADGLIRRVADMLGLNSAHALLDLGTGTGELAIAFAPYVEEVTAVDPEPQMLRIAGEQAARAGVRLNLVAGNSHGLDASLGRFQLVTIGRAFHLMDRPQTLQVLNELVLPQGAVALFCTRHPQSAPENAWMKDFNALLDRNSDAKSVRKVLRSADWVPDLPILLVSPFSALERISIIERRHTPLERMINRALSFSSCSHAPAEELAQDVRTTLAPFVANGLIAEVVESEALVGFRSRR